MKRIFAAVKIVPEKPLKDLMHSMQREMVYHRITWVPLKNIHITLKFFGETNEKNIPEICNVLSQAAEKTTAFSLQLSGTGVFGSSYDPRVIWAGLKQTEALSALAFNIMEGLKTIDIMPDRQNFVPHLTLGRIKKIADLKQFQLTMDKYRLVPLHDCHIDKLILFDSKMSRNGPEYTVVQSFSFLSGDL